MIKLAILASGSGSNAERIITYFRSKNADIDYIIACNNPQAGVLERAERLGVPVKLFDRNDLKSGNLSQYLLDNKVDWVILAGFLWLIPSTMTEAFPQRIINIHPALLPKYGGKGMYGHFVHEAVVENKETASGITIHYVNEHYDEGAIIFQASFAVSPDDTPTDVAKKGQQLEHTHFPEVIEGLIFQ